jgi:hypothetical protein
MADSAAVMSAKKQFLCAVEVFENQKVPVQVKKK